MIIYVQYVNESNSSNYDDQIEFRHNLYQSRRKNKWKLRGSVRCVHVRVRRRTRSESKSFPQGYRRHFRDYFPIYPKRIDPKTIRHFLSVALFSPNVQSQWEPMKNRFMQFQKLILLVWLYQSSTFEWILVALFLTWYNQ